MPVIGPGVQSIKGTVAGLLAACQTIYSGLTDSAGAPVLVTYGPPGAYQPECIVAVGTAIRQPVTRPTMGTNRSREKAAEIDVVISVYVPGTEVAQQVACEKADDLAELLDTWFRAQGQETLGGGCRDSWLSDLVGPTPAVVYDPASGAPMGRVAEVTCTITAHIRY